VFSRKTWTTQACASFGMATFASLAAIIAADDGILPSMALSALRQQQLMVWCT